ncbi:MAG: helix-turn-helix domain-containing protein [Anaerosomatales bacterium]
MDDLLDIASVADYLGVSERTVYNKVRSGELPAFKVGRLWRVRRRDLEAWIDLRQRGGTEPAVLRPVELRGASVVVESSRLPSRTDLETVLSAFEDRVERRLAFVGVLSRACTALGWPEPIVVGGHAVEFWTAGGYATADIDLVGATEPVAEVLSAWGFIREGRHWYDEHLGLVVEVPGARLSEDERAHVATVQLAGFTAQILGLEDLVIDRLNACVHWSDQESCMWAEALLAIPFELDVEYLRRRAGEEDVKERLEEALVEAGRS